ncbi:phosphoenolpyruvate--protein phosphotransferase [Ornithinimicrobium sp. Arc0846-15]|nr:phosphoenolpyruvate--protein phosphotransferase [Ornithinimicrobium laminariae]
MIGIVLVSHSHALGHAAAALASEMVSADAAPVIEVAAGLDETTFGTDAAAISEAISRADDASQGAGVLVLLDLGSAILSTEMALEFVDPDIADRVKLTSAPLVEGLIAAVVTASTGADLATVASEAMNGALAKSDHLGDVETSAAQGDSAPESTSSSGSGETGSLVVVVDIPHGLHARPAARLVAAVNQLRPTTVSMTNATTGKGPVSGGSLSAVTTLGALEGHGVRFDITAEAPDAIDRAKQALQALADEGFGDRPTDKPETQQSASTEVAAKPRQMGSGIGIALGPALRRREAPDLNAYEASGDSTHELERLQAAIDEARSGLGTLIEHTTEQVGESEAAVFFAHQALLDDPALVEASQEAVVEGGSAANAWHSTVFKVACGFESLADPYQRERGQDVRSVMHRVERALLQIPETDNSEAEGILVVDELDPAIASTLDPAKITGVVSLQGGATGHGAIIAKSRGVPVVTGAGERAEVKTGTLLGIIERTNEIFVDPDESEQERLRDLMAARSESRAQADAAALEPAVTTDGRRVLVEANVTDVDEAESAVKQGAEGSGLVRTEVVWEGNAKAPSVDEQFAVFADLARAMPDHSITVRTWDIGADKPMPFFPQTPEANPFLGVRGVRAFRADPTLLVDQLDAVCRVARQIGPVRVMFPMVSTRAEVDWVLGLLDEAAQRSGDGRPDGLEVGIMVEVPAAALTASQLAEGLDFVSIGTNDLTQYVMAAERGNGALGELGDVLHPAVLRMIGMVANDVPDGVRVAVCGASASDPDIAAILVGLGVTELSATAASVAEVKAKIRQHSCPELQDLAHSAMQSASADEVRELLV